MSMNEYTYLVITNMRAEELQARAEHDHLVQIARQAAKERRAAEREARRLQVAAHGRQGLRHALRTLFAPDRSDAEASRVTAVDDLDLDGAAVEATSLEGHR